MSVKPLTVGAFLLAAGVALAGALPAKAADMADVRLLVSNCFNCHGTNGVSAGVIDGLDELSAPRMSKALKQFKSGEKAATIMNRIAKGYSDAEIDAIAKYIATANGN
ncbi:MAG: c-type cytochrome [Hyphomicrobiales bacterium]|nr:c-type cytochrome [Hyphomicrobiales bacterium]